MAAFQPRFHSRREPAPARPPKHGPFPDAGDGPGVGCPPKHRRFHRPSPDQPFEVDLANGHNSEDSEGASTDMIRAVHGPSLEDTHALEQSLISLGGEIARLRATEESIRDVLHKRSEVHALREQLSQDAEERRKMSNSLADLQSRHASELEERDARLRQLEHELSATHEHVERQQQALHAAQQERASEKEQLAAQQHAADAQYTANLNAANSQARSLAEQLRAAQEELTAARQGEHDREIAVHELESKRLLELRDLQELCRTRGEQVFHLQREIQAVEAHYLNQLNILSDKYKAALELQRERGDTSAAPPPKPDPCMAGFDNPLGVAGNPHAQMAPAVRPALPRPALHNGIVRANAVGGRVVEAATRSVSNEIQAVLLDKGKGSGARPVPPLAPLPSLLPEEELVAVFARLIPQGRENARQWGPDDQARLEGTLHPLSWPAHYGSVYGSPGDFLSTHPEAFYKGEEGAFYCPAPPARRTRPPEATAGPTSTLPPPLDASEGVTTADAPVPRPSSSPGAVVARPVAPVSLPMPEPMQPASAPPAQLLAAPALGLTAQPAAPHNSPPTAQPAPAAPYNPGTGPLLGVPPRRHGAPLPDAPPPLVTPSAPAHLRAASTAKAKAATAAALGGGAAGGLGQSTRLRVPAPKPSQYVCVVQPADHRPPGRLPPQHPAPDGPGIDPGVGPGPTPAQPAAAGAVAGADASVRSKAQPARVNPSGDSRPAPGGGRSMDGQGQPDSARRGLGKPHEPSDPQSGPVPCAPAADGSALSNAHSGNGGAGAKRRKPRKPKPSARVQHPVDGPEQ